MNYCSPKGNLDSARSNISDDTIDLSHIMASKIPQKNMDFFNN